jgi:replicative DNA helicase
MVTSLGISDSLDAHLCGGVGAGELLIYLAPPSRGKTSFLWATGAAAAAQVRNVLGITLELSARKCVRRVDQWLSKFTQSELISQPLFVSGARKGVEGKLYFKDWSYTGITVDDIKALVTRMRQRGEKIDYLLVDYLELVKPVKYNRHAERHNWSQTAQDLRALAVDLQIPVITAWQVNREGSEQHVLSARDVSECWDVVKHADIILGLNQNAAEMAERVMRVNVIKQRESTDRPQVYLHCDMDRMIIRDGNEESDDDTTHTVGIRLGSGVHVDGDVPAESGN